MFHIYKKTVLFFMVFCVSFLSFFLPAAATKEELKLHARSALLMDADSGRVLYEENGYCVMPMASTTKIMTCILALESGKLDDKVLVSANAQKQPKVKLYLKEGEEFLLKDLLYSLMLESHNDTAVAIAEHLGGSVEGFAAMMNQKAEELQCEDTWFVTPNGLDAVSEGREHSTTAFDLAVIASYAIQNEEFRRIIGTSSYSFSECNHKRQCTVNNKDAFLNMEEGAIGIKTGFTSKAGYCFVGALEDAGRTFVSVVLGSGWPPNKSWKWYDTRLLMNYGTENFYKMDITSKKTYDKIIVLNGQQKDALLQIERQKVELLLCDEDDVEVKTQLQNQITAPVQNGTVVGREKYLINGECICEFDIKICQDVDEITWYYCFQKILSYFFL